MMNQQQFILFIPPVGSILLGLPYPLGLFGPTEGEVAFWGIVSIVVGLIGLGVIVLVENYRTLLARIGIGVGYLLIALLQVLPIQLWWQFHGRGISDGTPPSWFVAHWLFAMPHLLLLIAGLIAMGMIFVVRREYQGLYQ